MFIEGLSIGGYRSFGAPQQIGPCDKINLIAGPNNSGKSNILSFLKQHFLNACESIRRNKPVAEKSQSNERHIGIARPDIHVGIAAKPSGSWVESLCTQYMAIAGEIRQIFSRIASEQDSPLAWFDYEAASVTEPLRFILESIDPILAKANISRMAWTNLHNQLGLGRETDYPKVRKRVIAALSPAHFDYPFVNVIPAFRRVVKAEKTFNVDSWQDLSGNGLIDRLVALQNPTTEKRENRNLFDKINGFLRNVTLNDNARIEIPHNRSTINVEIDDKFLPLEALGTGIHEVIILASAATVIEDEIICIEEPELHLHPILQRKLVEYLHKETSNQYFITTHSAQMLACANASVFHIAIESGESQIKPVSTAGDHWTVCRDLGYRASDILQSNCVIWVEGPTDRIYINHWLAAVDPKLKEHIDYSIMFYGGRLLAHLSADDPEIDEFISLRRLNRNVAMLIDSDKSRGSDNINATKQRVANELNQPHSFIWITEGREIENYIDHETLVESVDEVVQGRGNDVTKGKYACVLPRLSPGSNTGAFVDKVKVARAVAGKPIVWPQRSDLKQKIEQLAEFIKECNCDSLSKIAE